MAGTASAAVLMSWVTSPGSETIATWLDAISTVAAPIRAANYRSPACRHSMTPLQHEPSAHAPWMRTIFGRVFISGIPSWSGLTAILRSETDAGYP